MLKAKNIYGGEPNLIGYINIECSADVLCVTEYGGTVLLSRIAEIEKPEKEEGLLIYFSLVKKIDDLKKRREK